MQEGKSGDLRRTGERRRLRLRPGGLRLLVLARDEGLDALPSGHRRSDLRGMFARAKLLRFHQQLESIVDAAAEIREGTSASVNICGVYKVYSKD